ncbi:MAG TPA: prephenate dehydrogenase/arogenate dehydrogenase family protein, partial [Solirubrobacterales bacterium]|nr:prephenate dehydrogenase/arogenate dehydrogenase family protein [Solirubrobacterales bacterium]
MKLAVLGVGLIGGSIGLAARERGGAEVRGFDPDPGTAERARELGVLDLVADSVPEAVAGAEVVICAGPVRALPGLVREALEASEAGVVVSDVGSTKLELAESVASMEQATRFIGGHPLAGAETAGVENSRADLFDGARWFLTPTDRSEGLLFDRLHSFLAALGARPQAIGPAEHDRAMATISHLPHVLANVLASRAAETLVDGERRSEVGRSFRDTIRVAGANPAIWGDIFAANSDAVAAEVDAVISRLERARDLLRAGDSAALADWQQRAHDDRVKLLESAVPGGELFELR